jgi:hypothetical protein
MGSILNENSMRISSNPEFFVSGLMKQGKKTLGIVNPGFCDQITGRYRYTGRFIKTSLYYLYFPKQVQSLKKNISINFFIHSQFNIFPVIVKPIGYFHLNFLKNKQEDVFLTKTSYLTSYLSKAPLYFNLSSQPVFRFQNIVISAVNKLIKSDHENRNVQKHEIRRKDLFANILFRDTSFFTCPGLNLIYSCADRNIAGRQSKPVQNLGAWKARESEFDSLRDGQNRLKFYKKQLDATSQRYGHGGMKLVISPYTGVHNMRKTFVKPGITGLFPAVLPFLQIEVLNKSNVEQRISGLPEKDFSYDLSISRTHHTTNIANFFRQPDVHNRVKPHLKLYLTKIPVTIMSHGKDIFNLYHNITKNKQPNISKEKITQPIPLIPFEGTAALGADSPFLPAIFSNSPVMHGNPISKTKDPDSHKKKRAKKQPVESDTPHINILKNINLDKKSIKKMNYIPFSNSDFTYGFSDKANKNSMLVIRRQCAIDFPKSLSENIYMIKPRYMFKKSGSVKNVDTPPSPGRSLSAQEPSMAVYRNNFPDMTYFSSSKSPHSNDLEGNEEVKKKTESFEVDSSCKTGSMKLLSVPGPDLYGLADKVYGIIVERIKRERELRGR